MALNPEQVEKINSNRKLLSQPLLTAEETASMTITAPAPPTPTPTPAAKPIDTSNPDKKEGDDNIVTAEMQAAELENQRQEAQGKADKAEKELEEARSTIEKLKSKPKSEATLAELEIDEAKIISWLKDKKGKEVVSLDEILNPKKEPTPDEIEAAAQQRENDKVAYALSQGIFNKKEFQSYIEDSNNKKDLVFEAYKAMAKKEDPALTDKEIEEEFKDKFNLEAAPDSRLFKQGQAELNLFGDNLIRQKHGKIIGFDNEYNNIEKGNLSAQAEKTLILSKAPVYKKDVEEVYSTLKNLSVPINGENFEIEIPKEAIEKQLANQLSDNYAASKIKTGWDKEDLKRDAILSLVAGNFEVLVGKAVTAYNLKHAAGSHGIPPKGDLAKDKQVDSARLATLKSHHGNFATQTN